MTITHVMADGTILTDITGKIVKVADAKQFYEVMSKQRSKRYEKDKEFIRVD